MNFRFNHLVIGGSFDAVYLAFKEGYPIIYTELEKPFEKDMIGDKSKKDFYEMILFLVSMADLNIFSFKIADIRIEEDNKVIVSGHKPWIYTIEAKNIYDMRNQQVNKYKVVDLIRIKYLGPHILTRFTSRENFVKEVIFEKDSKNRQFAKAVSYLNDKQLNDEQFSEIYSRLKVKQMVKDAGIRGKKKCIETRPGFAKGQRYTPPYLEFLKREIFKIQDEQQKEYKLCSNHPYICRLMEFMDRARKSPNQKKVSSGWYYTS